MEILEYYPFEDFWNLYDKKVDKGDCKELWGKIKENDKEQIMQHHLPMYVIANVKKFRKDPIRYLKNKTWENEVIIDENQNNQNHGKRNQSRLSQEGLTAAAYNLWGGKGD